MEILKKIKGFQPISLCDWPGKVSCVIFIGGCNFRCPTCHNKQIAFYPDKSPTIELNIFEYLKKKKNWLDGVVISGGEPTITKGLEDLIKEIKSLGFPVKLDTNGSNPKLIYELLDLKLVDLFAVDIKGPFKKYKELTGGKISEEEMKKNFDAIFPLATKYPSKFLFRLTKVPLLNEEDILVVKNYLPLGFELKVQRYLDLT